MSSTELKRATEPIIRFLGANEIKYHIGGSAPYDREVMDRAIDGILTVDDPDPIQVKFSSAEDIILNKLHWFRMGGEQSERQWRDILGVLNVQKKSLDFGYMRKWAREIGVYDL